MLIRPLSNHTNYLLSLLVATTVIVNLLPNYLVLPYAQNGIIWLSSMLLWLIIIGIKRPSFFFNLPLILYCFIGLNIYTIIFPMIFGNMTIGNRYLHISLVSFYYLVFTFNKYSGKMYFNYVIVGIVSPFIFYMCIITFVALMSNPFISRLGYLERSSSDFIMKNAGSYEFIYFLVFLCFFLFSLININKIKKSLFFKKLYFLAFLFLLIIILMSNYFTAIIMLLIGIMVYIFFGTASLSKKIIISSVFSIMYFLKYYVLKLILQILIILSPEGKNVDRVQDLLYLISNSNNVASLADQRAEVNNESISGLLMNPFFGISTSKIDLNDNFTSGVGQHSQFLDTYAIFGFFIGTFLILFHITFFYNVLRNADIRVKSISWAILFMSLIINYFDNITPLIGFGYVFVYLVFISWINEKQVYGR